MGFIFIGANNPLSSPRISSSTLSLVFRWVLSRRQASSKRWQARQSRDRFRKEALVQGLKSRAAFKLLQIDEKYRIFRSGQTVVDLGYAPGSWSQVAISRTKPSGRVLGIDIIPARPPDGVSTIQGNFLSPSIQAYAYEFLRDPNRGRPRPSRFSDGLNIRPERSFHDSQQNRADQGKQLSLGDMETKDTMYPNGIESEWTVDVVLSDMMMNTSGISFKDHAGSMDLCQAALQFGFNVLKTGGHFVCKFYQGAEDKALETQLKKLFQKVHKLKPESSRNVRH
jgi:21S rRNA (uridine2791-2'-O)-methyltransferase